MWSSATLCKRLSTQDPQPTKALGRLHHTLEAETPIGRSLLNEFFNKLMWSEGKQEIAKAKLKKARQQLNVQANPQQVQVGGGITATTPAQAVSVIAHFYSYVDSGT